MNGERRHRGAATSDADAVQALEDCWERLLLAHGFDGDEEFKSLIAEWTPLRATDPVALETDLLSPLGQELYEPAHTQAIAYLLDSDGRSLGSGPLEVFFEATLTVLAELDATREKLLLRLLQQVFARFEGRTLPVSVEAERASVLVAPEGEKRPKTDLWVELPAESPEVLLVIENKVAGIARPGQLAQYEGAIARRLAQLKPQPFVVKVYLTPWGERPPLDAGGSDWLPLGYHLLATEWTQLLTSDANSGDAQFLRLYLATVLQKVLGVSDRPNLTRAERAYLADYLRARLGRPR